MKYITMVLLAVIFYCGCTSKKEPSLTWPKGDWKRHAIDDSSQGADGTRFADINGDGLPDITTPFVDPDGDGFIDLVSNCEGKTKAIFVHWSPKDKNRLLDTTARETQELVVASGLGNWIYWTMPDNTLERIRKIYTGS